jgi:hypothetical protein
MNVILFSIREFRENTHSQDRTLFVAINTITLMCLLSKLRGILKTKTSSVRSVHDRRLPPRLN